MQKPVAVQAVAGIESWVPDTRGLNFYDLDRALQGTLALYLPGPLLAHLEPHLRRLGGLVGNALDDLAGEADHNPPYLAHRNRRGEDVQELRKHPSYRELERVAFGEFGLAAMSHRGGVLDWPEPMPPNAKYALTYLFVQSEFGLCCPVNMTDSLTRTIRKYGDPSLTERFLPGLTATEMDALTQGAMFITEQQGGSDVSVLTTEARLEDGTWRLYGEKWFCSNVDAELSLVLARPQGAGPGLRNLGLFLLSRHLSDGRANHYRMVRLKDKLGTRSMASGEIAFDGAEAYPVGDLGRGFVQMTEMINASRLSNGVRAAGLMRRSLTEALHVARHRIAFGKPLVELPLMQRQLLKLVGPTEQALSLFLFTGETLRAADAGDEEAWRLLRILTPLMKFRATRDARKVTADAMEVRGGSGYVEEWVHPRLVRDALLGSIWEGTSNVVALDVIRAVRREAADAPLEQTLRSKLAEADDVPAGLQSRLAVALEAALGLVRALAEDKSREVQTRQAGTALYNVTTAILLAWEGQRLAAAQGDARRMLVADLVLRTRLEPVNPLVTTDPARERALAEALLGDAPVALATVHALVDAG